MNRGLWIARKNYLCCLIRKVSELNGGDDEEFIKQHCNEVISLYPDEAIEKVIGYYQGLVGELKILRKI